MGHTYRMGGTIKLEDMRLFARVAEAKSFTAAARTLGMPKQTVSRHIAELERALGVQLIHRTTRRLHMSDAGAAYAERCADVVRIADEANRAATDTQEVPRGRLRITADPLFGEAFLPDLVLEFARRWPEVGIDVVLTQRRLDLVEEGFEVAFRVGQVQDASLSGFNLGPARIRYCASPAYVARRGAPTSPDQLSRHDCIVVSSDTTAVRWPYPSAKGATTSPVSGRLRFSSHTMAHAAARAGLGIAIFPEFVCAKDLRQGRLVTVLGDCVVEVGSVWLVHAARTFLPARVRAFAELARERFSKDPPWLVARGPRVGRRRAKGT